MTLALLHQTPPMVRIAVHEGVCRRIIRLARVAEGTRCRGERQEAIDFAVADDLIEIHDAAYLRGENRAIFLGLLFQEEAVSNYSRGMNDAIEPPVVLIDVRDEPLHGGAIRNVRDEILDMRAGLGTQLLEPPTLRVIER